MNLMRDVVTVLEEVVDALEGADMVDLQVSLHTVAKAIIIELELKGYQVVLWEDVKDLD
jgi:hypothetical protein